MTAIPGIGVASAQQDGVDNSPSYLNDPIAVTTMFRNSSVAKPIIKRVHQFALDAKGNLQGRVTDLQQTTAVQVYLLKNQSIVASAQIDAEGDFTLGKIQPGTYSLVVAGRQRIAARGISVVAPSSGRETSSKIQISTVATRYEGLKNLLQQSLDQSITQVISGNPEDRSFATNLNDEHESKQVRIINGSLRGQISSLIAADHAESVQIYLIQNGQPMYQVQTNALGAFLVPDVEPGPYDFVAVGKTGFAALRFEAIGSSATQLISFSDRIDSLLEVSLAESQVAKSVVEPLVGDLQDTVTNEVVMEPAYANPNRGPIEYASESIACGCSSGATGGYYGNYSNFVSSGMVAGRYGGFGGGFHGGLGGSGRFGGFLRSGGGFGRLLSLGALSGTIIAIADDNDPAPASPVTN